MLPEIPLFFKVKEEITEKAYNGKFVYFLKLFYGDLETIISTGSKSYHHNVDNSEVVIKHVKSLLPKSTFKTRRDHNTNVITFYFSTEDDMNAVKNDNSLQKRIIILSKPISEYGKSEMLHEKVIFRKSLLFKKFSYKVTMKFSQTSYPTKPKESKEVLDWLAKHKKDMSLTDDHIRVASTSWGPMAIYFANMEDAALFRLSHDDKIDNIIHYKTFDGISNE